MKALLLRLKRKCISLFKKFKMFFHSFDKNVVFSIGENCLSDNILARNNLKSFSSPYSSSFSNIEYVLSFEKSQYCDFLDARYLVYENSGESKKVRNKKYVTVKNHYDSTVMNGFEFTHHDILKNPSKMKTMKRRCKRMLNIKNKNIIMLYHHRYCENTDNAILINNLQELLNIYSCRNNKVNIFVFSQKIISNLSERRVEHESFGGVHFYCFYCLNKWCGNDEDVFWARCDDDLLKIMIDDIKKYLV